MKRQIPPLASLGRDDNGAELGNSVMVSEAEPSDALAPQIPPLASPGRDDIQCVALLSACRAKRDCYFSQRKLKAPMQNVTGHSHGVNSMVSWTLSIKFRYCSSEYL